MSYELLTADEEEADIISDGLLGQAEVLEQSAREVISTEKMLTYGAVLSGLGTLALEFMPQASPDRRDILAITAGGLAISAIAKQFHWRILYRKADRKRRLADQLLQDAGLEME